MANVSSPSSVKIVYPEPQIAAARQEYLPVRDHVCSWHIDIGNVAIRREAMLHHEVNVVKSLGIPTIGQR
jgi:hypothetical protein